MMEENGIIFKILKEKSEPKILHPAKLTLGYKGQG